MIQTSRRGLEIKLILLSIFDFYLINCIVTQQKTLSDSIVGIHWEPVI